MPAWFYTDGHISWVFFCALIYSGLFVLATDYAWRRVVISGRRFFASAFVLWIIVVIALLTMT